MKNESRQEFVSLSNNQERPDDILDLHFRSDEEDFSAKVELDANEESLFRYIMMMVNNTCTQRFLGPHVDPKVFNSMLLKYAVAGAKVGQKVSQHNFGK